VLPTEDNKLRPTTQTTVESIEKKISSTVFKFRYLSFVKFEADHRSLECNIKMDANGGFPADLVQVVFRELDELKEFIEFTVAMKKHWIRKDVRESLLR